MSTELLYFWDVDNASCFINETDDKCYIISYLASIYVPEEGKKEGYEVTVCDIVNYENTNCKTIGPAETLDLAIELATNYHNNLNISL